MIRLFFLLLASFSLFAADYDYILIGSSPFSLFEALYQKAKGNRVLILEKDPVFGGAWRSIDVCGLKHVDLGCHTISYDLKLKAFFETYVGCKTVSLDDPSEPAEHGKKLGWYFSQGCYELIENLLLLLGKTGVELHHSECVKNITFDPLQSEAIVTSDKNFYRAKKVITSRNSAFDLEGAMLQIHNTPFFHLYLLVEDPRPFQFTYGSGIKVGCCRMMNLTAFVEDIKEQQQLIALQLNSEEDLEKPFLFFEKLIQAGFLSPSATLLQSDRYTYIQSSIDRRTPINSEVIEELKTGLLRTMASSTSKWKEVLLPYCFYFPEN